MITAEASAPTITAKNVQAEASTLTITAEASTPKITAENVQAEASTSSTWADNSAQALTTVVSQAEIKSMNKKERRMQKQLEYYWDMMKTTSACEKQLQKKDDEIAKKDEEIKNLKIKLIDTRG